MTTRKKSQMMTTENPAQQNYKMIARHFPWYSESHMEADRSDIDEKYKDIHSACQKILSLEPLSLLLIGQYGTGKTYVLHAMVRHLSRLMWPSFQAFHAENLKIRSAVSMMETYALSMMRDVALITHYELVRMLRSSIGQDQDCFFDRSIKDTPAGRRVVFIDDVGRGYDDKGGFNLSLLDEYFDWRWRRRLATIVTSNKTIKELNDWEGWGRIVDRFADEKWMKVVPLTGKSKRRS